MSIYTLLVFVSILGLGAYGIGGDLKCYACTGADLDTCTSVSQTCRPEQNRCLSLLLEGGSVKKTYIKRCARANECDPANMDRMCEQKKWITGTGSCRYGCCEVDNCNHSTHCFASWVTIVVAVFVALKIII